MGFTIGGNGVGPKLDQANRYLAQIAAAVMGKTTGMPFMPTNLP
jgi:hypothetical protein